jgi:hypothetical protein
MRKGVNQPMNKFKTIALLFSLLFVCSCKSPATGIVWNIDNLNSIAGCKTTYLGSPKVIDTDKGRAVEFDGVKDGILVDILPIAGAGKFTLEIVFRPDANGLKEQRFLHLQENDSNSRTLIETRLTNDNKWYIDTYIETEKGKQALMNPANTHPVGQWYSASLVYDGREMRHYINGIQEMSKTLDFRPLNPGKTSIGVRMNKVYWFKGAVRKVRFTKDVLKPEELLKP